MPARRTLAILAVTLALAIASIAVRVQLAQTRPLAGRLDGQEPEAHIIVTEMAFDQVSWRTHHFLPLFTLGAATDKFIDEHPGADAPDRLGNYYYTSTPPLTFVLPYLAAKLTEGAPSLLGLRVYNLCLGVAAAAALAGLVWLCLARQAATAGTRVALTCAAAVTYLAAPESLKSHSIDIWAQQLTAVLLPLQVACLLFYPAAALLFLLAAVGCLADWTPYVANVAMAGLGLYAWWRTRRAAPLRAAAAIAAGSLCGGLAMIAWFHMVMPVGTYFHDLAVRSGARVVGGLRAYEFFLSRYAESLGAFALVGVGALAWRSWPRRPAAGARAGAAGPWRAAGGGSLVADPLGAALLILGASLLENPLMKDHALRYSYDRLKGVQFLALLVVWCVWRSRSAARVAFWGSAAAAVVSIAIFAVSFESRWGWNTLAVSQQQRIGAVIARTALPDGPVFFNGEVRGSEVYYAGRNIFQQVDAAAAAQGMDAAGFARAWSRQHGFSEATLYELSGEYPWPRPQDLPRSLTVTRVFADGRASPPETVVLDERAGDYHPMQSSERFSHLPDRFWK